MEISIFAITGPIMIGPSSSHTAGAARLGRVAQRIAGRPFTHVSFGLHGSFAKTGKGHGTDRALVAGVLGLTEDDEGIPNAFQLAERAGLTWDFYETEFDDVHENTVKMTFRLDNGEESEVLGSSVGGGRILIHGINGFAVELTAESPTLMIRQKDVKGVVSNVTGVLAENDINIGVMKLSRTTRGEIAFCMIETDGRIAEPVVEAIRGLDNILSVQMIDAG